MDVNEQRIEVFWQLAREKMDLIWAEPFIGQLGKAALMPPAVQLADDAAKATELAEKLLDEGELTVSTPSTDFISTTGEPTELPERGDLLIICNGDNIPVALSRTKAVTTSDIEVIETLVRVYPTKASAKK